MSAMQRIFFWNSDPTVSLDVYLPDNGENLPSAVILPGGAYFALSDREGGEVAEYFCNRGFASFVLRYSTMHPSFAEPDSPINPHTVFPEPLHEIAAALKHIRANAEIFKINPDRIALMGFSAGGHLAANYCNEWNKEEICAAVDAEAEEIKPNAGILCYAATKLHRASKTMNRAVFGQMDSHSDQQLKRWSAANNVNSATPPTFLWHCNTDAMVPVAQSYQMAEALSDAGIMHELHVFAIGDHASGLSEGMSASLWKDLAINFLNNLK